MSGCRNVRNVSGRTNGSMLLASRLIKVIENSRLLDYEARAALEIVKTMLPSMGLSDEADASLYRVASVVDSQPPSFRRQSRIQKRTV